MVPVPSENLLVLFERNDPIPLPHPLNVVVALCANSDAAIPGEPDCCDDHCVGWVVREFFVLVELLMEIASASLPKSTGVPRPESGGVAGVELGERVIQRPLTPSTALKKFVEPVARVFEMASRVGASCWPILRS